MKPAPVSRFLAPPWWILPPEFWDAVLELTKVRDNAPQGARTEGIRTSDDTRDRDR